MLRCYGLSTKKAIALSLLLFYGPFLLMGLYTLAFVDCSHCKKTVWILMPGAPGILPTYFVRLGLRGLSEGAMIAIAAGLSIACAVGLSFLFKARRKWIGVTTLIVILGWNIFSAYGLLAMVRA